jgi:large subunit ribosomal protein L18
MNSRNNARVRRHLRIRSRVAGTPERPRLSVFRSLQHIYAQVIDDSQSRTIISASDYEIETKDKKPVDIAQEVGKLIAQKAKDKKIKSIVFDRGGYQYQGLIRALAEGAREGGLQF